MINRKDIFVILFLLSSLLVFFVSSGTITSGYHFADDSEVIKMTDELSHESIVTVSKEWIQADLGIRYRPLFYIHRVLQAKIFGNNFSAWSVYNIVLLFFSLFLFYFGMYKKLNFSILETF